MIEDKAMPDGFKSTISKISTDFEKISADLDKEKRKSEQILQAIDECVFFLDSEYQIQDNYSKMFENIFLQKELRGQNFIDLLANKVPENIIENTREFLDFLFQNDMDEETINELNPLYEVEFHYEDQWGLWTSSKHLSFKFKRIVSNNDIEKLIGTAKDISEQLKRRCRARG